MGRKPIFGNCKICGEYTKLTFEHVPPRAAFNNVAVKNTPFEKLINSESLEDLSRIGGKISQKGAGSHTLCEHCNNNTGSWYANSFVNWSYEGLRLSEYTETAPHIDFHFNIVPLQVIKQIICMFFSANQNSFRTNYPDLVRFVLSKKQKYIQKDIRVYVYFNLSDRSRTTGIAKMINFQIHESNVFSEISFPPFGYIMCFDTYPPDDRLAEITHFASYRYNEFAAIPLKIPILPVYSYLPADFRTQEQFDKDRAKNIESKLNNTQRKSPE